MKIQEVILKENRLGDLTH